MRVCAWANSHARAVHFIYLDPTVQPWGDNGDEVASNPKINYTIAHKMYIIQMVGV